MNKLIKPSSISGLQKIGVGVAFLNTNNRHKPLLHSIQISEAKVLIVGEGKVFIKYLCLKLFFYLALITCCTVSFVKLSHNGQQFLINQDNMVDSSNKPLSQKERKDTKKTKQERNIY